MSKVLGLITARRGSKSIPLKNIAMAAGKPLIAWTIEAALKSHRLDRTIVSTDSEEIAQIARRYGAEVPFIRPAELSQDDSPHIDVVLHAIDWLDREENYSPEYVALLQPTSPLRTADDITAALKLADENSADAIVSVYPAPKHPYWMVILTEDGRLQPLSDYKGEHGQRQALPPVYAPNGAIYLARREVLLKQRTFYTDRTYGYVMPPERSIDVDSPWDLHLADLLLRQRVKNEGN